MTKRKIVILTLILIGLIILAVAFWFGVSDGYFSKDKEQVVSIKNEQNIVEGDKGGKEAIEEETDTSNWLIYRNEELGIEIKYPGDMTILRGGEVDPISGIAGIFNGFRACYFRYLESDEKVCSDYGVSFELKDVAIKNSLEGFDYMYMLRRERRADHDVGLPSLESLGKIKIDGHKYSYYQAIYFSGDSKSVEIYIPHGDKLLIYAYNIYPLENDPETEPHVQVAEAILSSIRLDN